MLQEALYYASLGLRVFPLHSNEDGRCSCGRADCQSPAKHPRTRNGVKDATADVEQIAKWWTWWPGANIGIATGGGVCVLDVDNDEERGESGSASLADWEEEQGCLPPTWLSLTGGGGLHYLFKTPDGVEVRNRAHVLPGVDVRGEGGYIVAPPSVHISGNTYEWEASNSPEDGAELAEVPEALLRLMLGRTSGGAAFALPEAVAEGGRNDTLFRLASSLRAKGVSEAGILAAVKAENGVRCSPPLSERECEQICTSAFRYEPGVSGAGAGGGAEPGEQRYHPPDYSDAGNAEIFAREYAGRLIHVGALGWLCWDGRRWERGDHLALGLAIKLMKNMLLEAVHAYTKATKGAASPQAVAGEDDGAAGEALKGAKAYLTHAQASRNANRIQRMMTLSEPALHKDLKDLDKDAFALNTPAGIIDLRTGALRPHDYREYITNIAEAAPGKGGAGMWEDFLTTITCGDGGLRGFLQMVSGMAAIGAVYHEGIIIAYGGGRNGKSTFFNAIGKVLGDYSGSIAVDTLTTDRTNKGASLATLRGKRLVVTGELEEHQRLSTKMLKAMASTDRLVAEEKFRQPEEFEQSHTLTLFTNHLPRVGSTDGGTWRRLTVVPFNATIPPGAGVQKYSDVLAEKAGGAILAWIVEGAGLFIRNRFKLDIPDAVAEMTDQYRQAEDWVSNFIGECCEQAGGEKVGGAALYAAYRGWAEANGDYTRRNRDFAMAMEAAGYKSMKSNGRVYWIGLRLSGYQPAGGGTYERVWGG